MPDREPRITLRRIVRTRRYFYECLFETYHSFGKPPSLFLSWGFPRVCFLVYCKTPLGCFPSHSVYIARGDSFPISERFMTSFKKRYRRIYAAWVVVSILAVISMIFFLIAPLFTYR